jgi:transcriptional regulator with XRE-family HTH domain
MKERIKKIMDNENLTPARFADKLQINRAVVSHILNGRNNPSLDVVMKILSEMDYINSDWLINGTGSMYRDGYVSTETENEQGLFDESAINTDKDPGLSEYLKEKHVQQSGLPLKSVGQQQLTSSNERNKKIKEIIIYYTDNTFETFTPH